MLRWGISSCGIISEDFVTAFIESNNSKIKITAVAATNLERAKRFAEKFSIEKYFGSYEDLAKCDDVDIVYVASIHSRHSHDTKLYLNHGKHVLVEKSMGMNVSETMEMIELARSKKLFLMEGLWSKFLPIYKFIKESVHGGALGVVQHVNANFQLKIDNRETVVKKEFGGGATLALGIYTIQFALLVFGDKRLTRISSNVKRLDSGVDAYVQAFLEFEDNKTAFLAYHIGANGDTSASICGSQGILSISEKFWCPQEFSLNGVSNQSFRSQSNLPYNYSNSWELKHEINHVAECIEKNMLESDIHSLNDSLRLAEIMEQITAN